MPGVKTQKLKGYVMDSSLKPKRKEMDVRQCFVLKQQICCIIKLWQL